MDQKLDNTLPSQESITRRRFFVKTAFIAGALTLGATAGGFTLQATHAAPSRVPLYRLYSSSVVDHWYTTDFHERDRAVKNGAKYEGTACYVYATQVPGSTPLYRLYSSTYTDHWYTIDVHERDRAVKNGAKYEDIACYVYATQVPGSTPLYRLYSSTYTDHWYTTDVHERDRAVKNGAKYEGIACWVFAH